MDKGVKSEETENRLCCAAELFPGRCNTRLLTPGRETMTDSTETTRVQLGEPMRVTEVTYRIMGEGLLTGA